MNLKNFTFLSLIASVALVSVSCDQLKDLTYNTTPNPLEMHGDSVAISVTVNIPPKGIKKKVSVEVTPVLGDTKLETWKIQGEKATGNGQSITFKPGGTATFTDVVAYNPSMEATDLKITGKIFKGTKEKDALPEAKLADATIITPLLVQTNFKMLFETNEIQRSFEKTVSAEINYLKGKSDLRPTELKDKDITDLVNWVIAAQSNPKIKINSIDVKGYASPDGEEDFNGNLSAARSKSGRTAFMELMKKQKLTILADSNVYVTNGMGEDFEGFKEQLNRTSTISQADKDLFLRVLTMTNDPKQREAQMKDLGKTFSQLEKDVFPKIRRSIVTVNYTEQGLSDDELKSKAMSNPSAMSADELIFTAGTLVKDINERAKIYDAATMAYPEDSRAFNNAGAAAFMLNNTSKAKTNLEKALNLKDNNYSKNNLAGVLMSQSDRKGAKKLLGQVKDKSAEVAYNNAIIMVLEGKYSTAVTSFGTNASFNKALAQVLSTKLDDASKTLAASSDKESADGYYLKAIIAARSNSGVDAVVSNLKSAIAKNAKYAEKAGKDREFIKFMADPSFTSVVK
jgi:Flp pilus assembly protein TadD/outer membrane protein OmpA-like peptidoglycan-associated protein